METIRFTRIGKEDINFGKGTFEARLADGRVVVLNQVDLGVLLSDATISTRDLTIDTLTVTTITPGTVAPTSTLRFPEKADPGSPLSGEVWINSGGTFPEYADDAGTPAAHQFVGHDTTQTLTNKTLTAPAISSPVLSGTVSGTYTLGGTPTLGASLSFDGNDLTNIDEVALNNAATNPTATGRLRRADNELLWRVSTGTMRVFYGEAGTVCLFFQANAPTGWTKLTTQNDKAIRIVSGTGGGTGGSDAFTTVFGAALTTASHTLTSAEMPSHTHTFNPLAPGVNNGGGGSTESTAGAFTISTVSLNTAGSSSGHTHNLTMNLQYIDVILASKD